MENKRLNAVSDLDIFTPTPTDASVAETRTEIIPVNIPLPNDDTNTPLEFHIPSVPDWYTDLSSTILELELKIQFNSETEKAIPRTTQIGLVSNALMTMFGGITVLWNNRPVLRNSNCLPWTAYLDVLSRYNYDARKSWLSASGWYDGGLGGITPQAVKSFKPFFENGTGRFIGPIQADFFRQTKFIIPGVEMVIQFTRQDPSFYIINMIDPLKPDQSFKVIIERAYLHICRIKLYPETNLEMEKRLLEIPAAYEYMDTVMKPIVLPDNVFSIDTTVYEGRMPSRLDIVQLSQSDFTGPTLHTPFAFQHAYIKSVRLEKNGQLVSPPYQCDFPKSNYARMYLDYFKNSGCSLNQSGMSEINYDKFKDGYTIMSFNLERFDECTNLKPEISFGSLRLKIDYDAAAAVVAIRPLVILCLMKFKRAILLNAQREIMA